MRYCVVGAGAMGGLYGIGLAASGCEVDFYDVDRAHVDAIRANGFRLSGATGDRTLAVRATADTADLAGTADIVLFHPHTLGTRAAAEAANAILKPEGWAVTLQNGIGNVEILAEVLGAGRAAAGVSYHSAALGGPGHAIHTNPGVTRMGEVAGGPSPRLEALAEAMRGAGLEAEVVADVEAAIWTKFILNCAVNALCAVSGLRTGEVARNPSADAFQDRIVAEAMAVVEAKGIKLLIDDPVGSIKRGTRRRYNRPSMLQHMEAARPTEIHTLNAALASEAAALGVPAPFNEALSLLVKAREEAVARDAAATPRDYEALEAEAAREAAAG